MTDYKRKEIETFSASKTFYVILFLIVVAAMLYVFFTTEEMLIKIAIVFFIVIFFFSFFLCESPKHKIIYSINKNNLIIKINRNKTVIPIKKIEYIDFIHPLLSKLYYFASNYRSEYKIDDPTKGVANLAIYTSVSANGKKKAYFIDPEYPKEFVHELNLIMLG